MAYLASSSRTRSALARILVSVLALGAAVGCAMPTTGDQGGAVQSNDRTSGGVTGESLQTGVMIVAPTGRYSLLQRNDVSVLLDVVAQKTRELSFQAERFVFAHEGDVGYAWDKKGELVALDLATGNEKWRVAPSSTDARTLSISQDDGTVLVGAPDRAALVDTQTGKLRGEVVLASVPTSVTFLPGGKSAVFVGSTTWSNHLPETVLTSVGLANLSVSKVSVPNCAAPLVVVPDGSRGFLSPTYCIEDRPPNTPQTWTNPDPVSVVDFDAKGATFLKNLPGFGPVALDPSGQRAVAYLDTARMDAAMFDDKSLVPAAGADPFHLMVIDTRTLKFTLTPIGHALPRFAMARDGKSLLVDASVKVERLTAKAKLTLDEKGVRLEASAAFGSDAPFGTFDLETRSYAAFAGPVASLDRFVQTSAGQVFTLKATADGLGGDLYRLDLGAKTTTRIGTSLRDIGILPDGKTLLLRIRLPAVRRADGFHRSEEVCFSKDGVACESRVIYESTSVIPGSTSSCADSHDC